MRQNYYNIIYCVLNQNIFESRSVKTASDNGLREVFSAYRYSLYMSNFPKNLDIIKIKHKSDAVMTEGD